MLIALLIVADEVRHLKAAAAMRYSLLMRLSACGVVSSVLPVRNSSLRKVGFAQVVGNEFRLAGNHIRVAFLEGGRDPRMEFLASALEQALVGRISH
jgi:hypothetical protein